jgi:V8-like Glu-specific endopeptidase
VQSLEPPGNITYSISTLPGQSGCPIIFNNEIIGLHLGAGKSTQFSNMGILITADVIANLLEWRNQLNTDPFVID